IEDEVLDEQHLIRRKGSVLPVRPQRLHFLQLTAYNRIGTIAVMLHTLRYAIHKACPPVCHRMMGHQALQIGDSDVPGRTVLVGTRVLGDAVRCGLVCWHRTSLSVPDSSAADVYVGAPTVGDCEGVPLKNVDPRIALDVGGVQAGCRHHPPRPWSRGDLLDG